MAWRLFQSRPKSLVGQGRPVPGQEAFSVRCPSDILAKNIYLARASANTQCRGESNPIKDHLERLLNTQLAFPTRTDRAQPL